MGSLPPTWPGRHWTAGATLQFALPAHGPAESWCAAGVQHSGALSQQPTRPYRVARGRSRPLGTKARMACHIVSFRIIARRRCDAEAEQSTDYGREADESE
jgi:hypothetical protein